MADQVGIRTGTFAGHIGEVVSQDASTVVVELVVPIERGCVEFPDEVVPRLRQELIDRYEQWLDDEHLAYFTDSVEWDGYDRHVAEVGVRAETLRAAMLDRFDRESAGWSADQLEQAQQDGDAALEPYRFPTVFPGGPAESGWGLLDSILGIEPSGERDRARERRSAAADAAFERHYAAWRAEHPAPDADALAAGRERVAGRWSAVEERVARDWGFSLPGDLFRFEVVRDLAGDALQDGLGVTPTGVLHVVADPTWQPLDGTEVLTHGRHHRDPPELLPILAGRDGDGRRWGLWFADGRTCAGVASYGHDSAYLDGPGGTALEAVRLRIEERYRDHDERLVGLDHTWDRDHLEPLFALRALRELVMRFETDDRSETGLRYVDAYPYPFPPPDGHGWTADGAGALLDGRSAEGAVDVEHGHRGEDGEALLRRVAQARRLCADGDPAAALILGRDLHWTAAGDPERARLVHELLAQAYRALGRDTLAAIVDAHHRSCRT